MRSVRAAIATPRWLGALLGTFVLAGALTGAIRLKELNSRSGKEVADAKLTMSRLPLIFEANRGQTASDVKFMSRGAGYNFYITPTASYLALARLPDSAKHGQKNQRLPKNAPVSRIKMSLVGGNPKAEVRHEGKQLGISNYFIGNKREKWVTDVPSFGRVVCEEVWKGVDLVYYGNRNELEHDFILAPGTKTDTVRLDYAGLKAIHVDSSGDLVLNTGVGEVRQAAPIAYQMDGGKRQPVKAEYQLLADNRIGFKVGAYDESRELVIDPVIRYSTYIGGSMDDYAYDIQVDPVSRNAYITGYTGSFIQDADGEPNITTTAATLNDYPTQNPVMTDPERRNSASRSDFDTMQNPNTDRTEFDESGYDAFVSRFSANGTGLLYSTYFGAESDDYGMAIATSTGRVADEPYIYITGATNSTFWPLQVALQTRQAGRDAFVVKLDPSQGGFGQLVFSTYLGGNQSDTGRAIAVDNTGNVHVAGITSSSNLPVFSTTGLPYQSSLAGSNDIFLVSLDASGSAFNYYTYFGGTGNENGLPTAAGLDFDYTVPRAPWVSPGTQSLNRANAVAFGDDINVAIAVDTQGNTFVAGGTTSGDLFNNFPASGAAQPGAAGGTDGYVAKFNPSGLPVWGTYHGGTADDACRSVAINPQGQVYVTGYTATSDGSFPVVQPAAALTPAYYSTYQGGTSDAFVTKFNSTGSVRLFSSFLGGTGTDIGNDIAVSTTGQSYLCGTTTSTFPSFPLINPAQNNVRGAIDAFIVKYTPDGSEFEYSTYFGGGMGALAPADDIATAIAIDPFGQAYVTGTTASGDMPVSLFAYSRSQRGPGAGSYEGLFAIADAFVVQPHSPPFAPSNLIATAIGRNAGGQHFVSMAWTDNSDNEFGFEVERKLGDQASSAPFQTIQVINTANTVTHTDVPLVATTTYTYRVRPFNQANVGGTNTTFYGPYSNQLTVTTLPEPPLAPTNLVVTPIDTQRLKLDWNDTSNNEASFKIERRKVTPPSTSFTEIVVILSDSTTSPGTGGRTYTDDNNGSGLLPNTTYEYRIRSSNVAGDSAYLGPVAGKTLPNAPTIAPLLSVASQTNSRISLSWTYANNDQLGFRVYRAPETSPGSGMPGTYTLIRSDTQTTATVSPPFNDVYTFSDLGLGSNTTYFYQVRSYNQSGDGPLSNQVSGTTLPDPPLDASNLDVTLIAGTTADIRLTWTDNSQSPAEESGFKIERSPDGTSGWTQVATVGQQVGLGTVSTDLLNQTRNTVHYFRVIAYTTNPSGDSDALPSNVDCAMTLPLDASGLTATPVSQAQINLSWTDNNPNGTQSNFRIERGPSSSGPWTTAGTTGLSPAGGTKNFSVTGLTQNTEYFFQVRTFNTAPPGCDGGGDSPAYTSTVSAFTLPGATTTVAVTNIPPTTNLRITFTDANQPTSQSQHLIERAEAAGGPWTPVTDLAAGVTTFDDTDNGGDLDGNFTFFYRVTAHNASGSAAPSAPASRLTLPAAASGLTVTVPMDILNGQRRGRTQLDLTWTDNSRVPTAFRVERSPDGTNGWTFIGTAPVGAGAYTDTNLTENTTYCYRVFGENASGQGAISSPSSVCATTLKVPPTGPTGLTATVISETQINLAWTDTSTNEEYFRIDRKIGVNGAYSNLVPMLAANSQSYQDTGLMPDTTYTYIVYAVNNGGDSLPSREAGGTTLKVAPAAPTNLVVAATSATTINIQWDDNANNETGFELERTPNGGSPTVIQVGANSAANPVSYNDTGLSPNLTYSYRVRAKNNNFSAWVGPQSALTHPANPSNLSATALSATRIRLTWTDNNGANPSGNRILRRKAGDPGFVILTDRSAADGTTYNDDNVDSGTTYTYVVFAINLDQVLSAQSTNEASATTPAVPPAAPINLEATASSSNAIVLTWIDKANNETLFKIERSTDGVTFRQIATRGSSAGVDQTVTYTDQGLVAGTLYIYRVRAANGGGDSAYSNEDDATTLPIPPGAPSALTATALSTTSIRLDWTDGSSNEDEFQVQRKNLMTGVFEDHAAVGANVTTYTDTGLTADTVYEYRVFARNGGGPSGFSNTANARTFPNPPAAPSNFVATPQSQSSIRLTWQDNSNNETSFRLSRSTDDVTYNTLVVVAAGTTNYTDQGLLTNTRYYYRLVATNLGGDSAAVSANATTHPNPPTAPTGLAAQALSQTSIQLTWTDTASTETGFRLERRTASGQFAVVGTPAQNAITFTDTNGLVANTTYTYRLAAVNDGGSSTYSNDATATTLPNPPTAPSNLTVVIPAGSELSASAAGSTQLTLNWVDQSDNETSFKIERRTAATAFALVGTVGANVTTFTDTGLSPQTLYFYQVKASNAGGDSAASNDASGTTLPNPPGTAPNNLTATALSNTQIRLNWTEAIADETGFKIERRTAATSFAVVGSAGQNATEFVDGGLTPSTTYFYQVRAINSGGEGTASSEASGTTLPNPPAAPSDVVVIGVDASTLRIQWRDNSNNEDGFKIDRLVEGNFVEVNQAGANATTVKISGLPSGVVQTFRVRAFNAGGESVSGEASGVTPSSGRLRVSKAALNFGTVAQGNSATRTVRLTNIGTGPLQVGYVAPAAPYSVDAPTTISLMLQPRQFVDVVVRFTPTARGRATGTLQVTSSDARKPRATVRLTGVGGAVRK